MEDIIVFVFKTGQRTCLQITQSVIYLPCWWYPVTSFHVLVVRCSTLRGCLIHPPLTHCQAARSCLLGDVVHQVFNISPSVSFLTMCLYRLQWWSQGHDTRGQGHDPRGQGHDQQGQGQGPDLSCSAKTTNSLHCSMLIQVNLENSI